MIGADSPSSYPNPPLSQLREMLTTSASEAEHNSDDHHDVKDLSFRSNPPQAPSITSTGVVPTNGIHHMDTSDYDSTRSPTTSSGTTSTASTRMTAANNHLGNLSPPHAHENVPRSIRMRKLSETSTDVEHCNNNYKFKNYIQQRFTHENYHSEESMQSNQCPTEHEKDNEKKLAPETTPVNESTGKTNGHHDIKNEILIVSSPSPAHQQPVQRNGKIPNGTANGSVNGGQSIISHHSIPIPIFACHTQGFYVPLNVDYDLLIPFLPSGMDLLNKNYAHLPPLHPISININYTPALIKNAIASTANNFIKPKIENGIVNGW